MSWIRIAAVAAALTVHIGAIASVMTHGTEIVALQSGSGQDNLSVIAAVTIQPDDSTGLDAENKERTNESAAISASAREPEPLRPESAAGTKQEPRDESVVPRSPIEPVAIRDRPAAPSPAAAPEEERHATGRTLEARRNSLFSLYNAAIYKAIATHAIRPEATRKGQVGVELTLSPAGKLLMHRVVKSSGFHVLDQTAIASLSRVPFPSAPVGLLNKPYTVTLSFDYAPQ